MLRNKITKKLCLLLSVSIIAASAAIVPIGAVELNPPAAASEQENPPAEGGGTTQPEATPINISANYFAKGGNEYTVLFSSLDNITNLKSFTFTISFANAEIKNAAFNSDMEVGEYRITTVGKSKAEFKKGSETELRSGKIALCSIDIVTDGTALSAQNVSFTDFEACNEENDAVKFNPTLSVNEGPVVPELTEEEQEIYDEIAALPHAADLSFYGGEQKLIDINEFYTSVTNTKKAYDALTKAQKEKIGAVLEYNSKTTDDLNSIPPIAAAMNGVSDAMYFYSRVKDLSESKVLLENAFIFSTYDKIKDDISSKGLPAGSTVLTQYNAAAAAIEEKSELFNKAFEAAEYADKIDSIQSQVKIIQTLNNDAHYEMYFDVLLAQANALLKDIKDNYTGNYKEYMIEDLTKDIDEIEMLQKGVTDLPKYTVGRVNRGMKYSVVFTRSKAAALNASVEIVVYDGENPKKEIGRDTFKFDAGSTNLEARMTADSSTYPKEGKIIIKPIYTVSGAEFELESVTTDCIQTTRPSSSVSGIPSTSGSSSSGTSGGTKYPDLDPDDEVEPKPIGGDEKPLFNDIDNYPWAKEAIEGLYYAGIVNGMEEGVFNPAGNVTREQFCKMAVQLFGVLEYETSTAFADVKADAWYAPYISSAIKAGYVQGQSNDYFGIGESIMRQDMATILFRGLGSKGKAADLDFTDNDAIAPYATDAISELVGLKIINGYEDGSFKPRGTATRAEAAKVIWGIYKIINDK